MPVRHIAHETCGGYGACNWPGQMTTASDVFPYGLNPGLPFCGRGIGGKAVLNKEQPPTGPEYALRLGQRSDCVLYRTQREGRYHRVETIAGKGERFGHASDEICAAAEISKFDKGTVKKLGRRVDARQAFYPIPIIIGQIRRTAAAKLQYIARRQRHHARPVLHHRRLAAGAADQARNNMPVPPAVHACALMLTRN